MLHSNKLDPLFTNSVMQSHPKNKTCYAVKCWREADASV